jgi:hypothetical protein
MMVAFARLAGGVLKGWARRCRLLPMPAATDALSQ